MKVSSNKMQDVNLDDSSAALEKNMEAGKELEDEPSQQSTESANSNGSLSSTGGGFSATWTRTISKIHAPIIKFLQALTQMAAKNPKRTMTGVASFSLLILVIGLFTNFTVDVDEDRLWTPADSRPIQHSEWIEDDSGFPDDTHNLILFFHSNGANVLGQEQVGKVFEAFNAVVGANNYDTMCAESSYIGADGTSTCEIDGIVNFWNRSSAIFEAQISSNDEAIAAMSQRTFPDGTKTSDNGNFGKPQRDPDTDLLTSALAYTVVLRFPPTDAAESFEDDILDTLLDMRDAWEGQAGNTLRLEVTAEGSFSDEFERAIVQDIPLIPVVFIIMSIFTALVFFKCDKVQSRSLLGFGAVVAVLLSLLTGFGLLFTIGVPFTSMTQILPFVIFGIGLDDAFIIYGAYSRTSPNTENTERIRETIDEVGISITLTSVTSSLAFGLGCLSSIPAVYWLCLYAFPTILFIYLYQLTFFVSWIVLDERRIQHNKRDCCICITVEVQSSEDSAQEHENNNNSNSKDASSLSEDGEQEQVGDDEQRASARNSNGNSSPNAVAAPAEPKENTIDAFMERYAEFLLQPIVKVFVIIAFVVLAVVCSISASKLTQEFRFTDVMPDDSYVTDFFDAFDEYTVRNSIAPFAYFRGVDQSKEDIQTQMQTYVDELVDLEAVEEPPEHFWLLDLKDFVQEEGLESLTFNQQVEAFLSNTVYFDLYDSHIVRNGNGDVTTSRVQLYFDNVDVEDVNEQIDTLKAQRDVARRQPINQGQKDWKFFSYDGIYNIWEFYSVSVEELILTTILGVSAVTGVALVLVPHWTAALFVLPMICLLYVDLLGVMQWAGVHVNAVSYISLVMSIGLLVDFIMHVLVRYYECEGNRRQKTIAMLKTMGSSILIGGISTFLGTLPLVFSTSTIFFTIFIAFVGLVTLGIGHGLILLPVVLSLVGPEEQISLAGTQLDKEMSSTIRTAHSSGPTTPQES